MVQLHDEKANGFNYFFLRRKNYEKNEGLIGFQRIHDFRKVFCDFLWVVIEVNNLEKYFDFLNLHFFYEFIEKYLVVVLFRGTDVLLDEKTCQEFVFSSKTKEVIFIERDDVFLDFLGFE